MPEARAISTAKLAAAVITTWPMPWSPSISAVAGERSTTVIFAFGFITPRLSWRT